MTDDDHSTGAPRAFDARSTNGTVDGDGAMPLLELEPSNAEKAGENPVATTGLNDPACYAPLLGTSYYQSIENARGSSEKRSPKGVCYDKLLQENGPSSGGKSRKIGLVEGRVCSCNGMC